LIQDRVRSLDGAESSPPGRAIGSVEAALSRLSEAAIGLAIGFMLEGSGMYSDGSEQSIHDGYASLAMVDLTNRLHAAVDALSPQEQAVVKGHYFHQRQFVELAEQLSLTKGRISQIHRQAVERLRAALREDLIGFQG
jgi:RNA polymerase sigma factor for flagellar operon FliA